MRATIFFIVLLICMSSNAAKLIPQMQTDAERGQYQWQKAAEFYPVGTVAASFKAKASNDIHVALAVSKSQKSEMYEVVIGGWGNTRTVIRDAAQGSEIASVEKGTIVPGKSQYYWVMLKDNKLRVGKGRIPGKTLIIEAPVSSKKADRLKYIAFSSWDSAIEYEDIRVYQPKQFQKKPVRKPAKKPELKPVKKTVEKPVKLPVAKPPLTPSKLIGEYLFEVKDYKDTSGADNTAKILVNRGTKSERLTPFCTSKKTGQYLEIPLNSDNRFTSGSFSVSFWLNTSLKPEKPVGVVTNYLTSTTPFWSFAFVPNGNITFNVRDKNRKGSGAGAKVNDGKWHHVVGVRDTSKSQIRVYMDGSLKMTREDTSASVDSGQSIWVGNHLYRGFEGCIDDLRLYQNVLTDDEIKSLLSR